MQFSVSKSALCAALALVGRVAEKRSTIPILSNLKLHADGDSLTITGTDLDVALSVRVAANVTEPGTATLPSKKLYDYSRLLVEGDIKLKTDGNVWATITAGRSRTRIAGMSPESFPELPAVPEEALAIPVAPLLTLINRAKLAITAIESRFTLSGALLDHRDGRLHLIATDGHRLAYAWAELAGDRPTKFILPMSAIRNLPQVASGVESLSMSQDDGHIFFRVGEATLIVRKVTGNFPDYERVLPKESKIAVTINRADLAGALSRVSQFADERSRSVKLTLKDGELEIFATTVEAGESAESMPCDYAGDPLTMVFNAQYISEFLAVIDTESVTLHLNDAKSAGEFRPAWSNSYRYVVMPMRI
jgi:DNA polymerase-3 subunit beta